MVPQPASDLWPRAKPYPSPTGTMDTAADGHYISSGDKAHLLKLSPVSMQQPSHPVLTANNTIMTSTHHGTLALESLGIPRDALSAHIFDDTTMGRSLLSMPVFADSGYPSIFTKSDAFLVNDRDPDSFSLLGQLRSRAVALAERDPTGLWTMPLVAPPPAFPSSGPPGLACSLVHNATNAERVRFFSRTFGSLPATTLITAVTKGLFVFPGITAAMIRNNLPNDIRTPMGHMRLVGQGQRSTRPSPSLACTNITETSSDDFYPAAQPPTRELYTRVQEVTRQQYIDATGAFPARGFDGTLYILCIYDFDSNYIRAEPLCSNKAPDVRDAYKRALAFFRQSGFTPVFLRLDNATSTILETFLKQENITFQFVAPSNHRANAAERAIQTFKHHLISIICGSDPDFPIQYWSDLIAQAELTLNLVRASRVTPNQSAYQHVTGVAFPVA
jgi:hypothetical protein